MNNVILLGDIKNSVTIYKSILVEDKNDHKYFVLQVEGGKILFVQSFTKIFGKLYDKNLKNSLDGSQIVPMKNNAGKIFLDVI